MPNSNRKLGLLPGSVVYTGENPNYNITVTVIYYSKNSYKRDVFLSDDKIDINFNFDGNIWINIDGINDVNLIKEIGRIFDIDSLSLEDIANPEQRVKIDDRDSYIHIILKMLQIELLTKEVQYEQLSLIIKDNILITFQETPYDMFESIRSRLENPNTKLASKDISYLAYILIDTIVDNYLLVLDEVETEIDDIENKLVESADREDLENILSLKQNIAILKKFISPVRELIYKLQTRSMLNYFHEDMKYYLSDLNDHGIIVFDTVDMLNNRATELIHLGINPNGEFVATFDDGKLFVGHKIILNGNVNGELINSAIVENFSIEDYKKVEVTLPVSEEKNEDVLNEVSTTDNDINNKDNIEK